MAPPTGTPIFGVVATRVGRRPGRAAGLIVWRGDAVGGCCPPSSATLSELLTPSRAAPTPRTCGTGGGGKPPATLAAQPKPLICGLCGPLVAPKGSERDVRGGPQGGGAPPRGGSRPLGGSQTACRPRPLRGAPGRRGGRLGSVVTHLRHPRRAPRRCPHV